MPISITRKTTRKSAMSHPFHHLLVMRRSTAPLLHRKTVNARVASCCASQITSWLCILSYKMPTQNRNIGLDQWSSHNKRWPFILITCYSAHLAFLHFTLFSHNSLRGLHRKALWPAETFVLGVPNWNVTSEYTRRELNFAACAVSVVEYDDPALTPWQPPPYCVNTIFDFANHIYGPALSRK